MQDTATPQTTATQDLALSQYLASLEAIYWVVGYGYFTAMAIGIPGNIMAILVTTHKDNRGVSASYYMAALAGVDLMTLLSDAAVPLLSIPMRNVLGDGIGTFLVALWYLTYTFAISSSLLLMEMSVDRLVAIRFPLAASRLCTTRRAKWTIGITLILVFALNSNVLFIYKYTLEPTTGIQTVQPSVEDNPGLEMFGSMFQLYVGAIIPFAGILIVNVWIIITVKRSAIKQRKLALTTGTGSTKREQETSHLTRMLILVSGAYIVCSAPLRVYEMVMALPVVKSSVDFDDPVFYLRYKIGYTFTLDLWILNFGVNFYLYVIGGRKFRQTAKKIVVGWFCICGRNKRSSLVD